MAFIHWLKISCTRVHVQMCNNAHLDYTSSSRTKQFLIKCNTKGPKEFHYQWMIYNPIQTYVKRHENTHDMVWFHISIYAFLSLSFIGVHGLIVNEKENVWKAKNKMWYKSQSEIFIWKENQIFLNKVSS